MTIESILIWIAVGLIAGWLAARGADEDFRDFCDRMSDEELGILAGREPARAREEKEAA
jgi:hypothetical protein